MYYIVLNTATPEPEIHSVDTEKADKDFQDIAMEIVGTDYLESVTPRGLEGAFGFYMDENAISKGLQINPTASVLYESHIHGHCINGSAVIGKWQCECGEYYLDFMNENELNKVKKMISDRIKEYMIKWGQEKGGNEA